MKFAVMDCNGGDDTCFCVHGLQPGRGVRPWPCASPTKSLACTVEDQAFAPYFEGMPRAEYTHRFVEKNELKVTPPTCRTRRCAWP